MRKEKQKMAGKKAWTETERRQLREAACRAKERVDKADEEAAEVVWEVLELVEPLEMPEEDSNTSSS